jgi:hypothetical protein
MVNRDFTVGANNIELIQYKKGMQGHLLEESVNNNGTKVAKIFIQGVTEGNNFNNQWVPREYIDVGMPWKDALKSGR